MWGEAAKKRQSERRAGWWTSLSPEQQAAKVAEFQTLAARRKRNAGIRRHYREHGEEYRAKISASMRRVAAQRSPETWARLIQASHTGNATRKRSAASKARWADPVYRDRLLAKRQRVWDRMTLKERRERAIKAQAGRYKVSVYKNGMTQLVMKSSYEVNFAKWCDQQGIEWRYEPKTFYVGGGRWRGVTYTPDFYLPELGVYVELKGYLEPSQARKYVRFQQRYPDVPWILISGSTEILFASSLAMLEAA